MRFPRSRGSVNRPLFLTPLERGVLGRLLAREIRQPSGGTAANPDDVRIIRGTLNRIVSEPAPPTTSRS